MKRQARYIFVLWLLAAIVTPAASQTRISGTVYDSLSVRGPLPNATVVLVERSRYVTTDASGRFLFEDVPASRYSLGLLHAVLDSFDLVVPLRVVEVASGTTIEVALATPSAVTAYMLGCAARLSQVATKADVAAYLKISASCAGLARRAAQQTSVAVAMGDSAAGQRLAPQVLQPVVVRDTVRTLSPMAMYGFEDRRRLGLGAFVTPEMLATHHYETLAALLSGVRGVRVEWGTSGQPTVLLRGNKEGSCLPTIFIDGVLFYVNLPPSPVFSGRFKRNAFSEVSALVPPWTILGIEVYSTPGVMPAQFDYSSSTGCGSIVIWTR